MPAAKRVKSRVAVPKRAIVATTPHELVPGTPIANFGVVELKIAMLPHAEAPSAAHWQSFAASIARINSRGYRAPTVWVDPDLRGATVQIAGWDTATAIRMVGLHATNSPSPALWQSQSYRVTAIHSEAEVPS
jgi:hypothetical protein